MKPDRVSSLLEIVSLVRAHGDDDLSTWLSAGVDAFISGEDFGSALGLTGAARQAWRHCERNRLLCEAGRLVDGDGGWSSSKELAKEVRALYRVWPRLRQIDRRERSPASRVRTLLCEALDLGIEIPLTIEGLHKIRQVYDQPTKSVSGCLFVDETGGSPHA